MNYARFLNKTGLARKLVMSQFNKLDKKVLNFTDVLPNASLFPIKGVQFKLRDGSSLDFNEQTTRTAMEYCPTSGNSELLEWLKDFQKCIHNPPSIERFANLDRKLCMTAGCMDGLCKTFEMLISEGDDVLIESPTYSGVISALEPLGCNIVPVECDDKGIIPSRLADTLQNYHNNSNNNNNNNKKKMPKFLYTVPNGGNPTGASTSHDRKVQIYELAKKHDFLILEDDPYYFLQFDKPRLQSYLSMDVDGRVLRFDSFSKILSSGIRLGFITGVEELVNPLISHLSTSSRHASHFSQMMVLELLKRWQIDGFEKHIQTVIDFYKGQMEAMIRCANKRLAGLAQWHEPVAGMFLWIKLLGIEDSQKLIEEKALEKKVLLVPGRAFLPSRASPSCYVRASYSQADESSMDEGFRRLAELIKEEQKRLSAA